MTLALEALEAQRDYVPRVNVRLASVATFILRIARHEGWEDRAQQLLAAWAGEQTGYFAQEDDIATALTLWMGREDWKPNVELTATLLNKHLCRVMEPAHQSGLSWEGSHLKLAKIIGRNLKIYASGFGLKRGESTLRTSRGNHTYKFDPAPELLNDIKKQARYEIENSPKTVIDQQDMPF
jgi:hypothetical protein